MKTTKKHPLIGSWVNGDEYSTEVEYIVSGKAPQFKVRVVDRFDGEVGEVRDVLYDAGTDTLSLSVYWASTGRFLKVRMHAISPNRISYNYTVTENQMWFRKGAGPKTASDRKPSRKRKNPRKGP